MDIHDSIENFMGRKNNQRESADTTMKKSKSCMVETEDASKLKNLESVYHKYLYKNFHFVKD